MIELINWLTVLHRANSEMGDFLESGRSRISEADTEELMFEADVNVGLNHINVSEEEVQ